MKAKRGLVTSGLPRNKITDINTEEELEVIIQNSDIAYNSDSSANTDASEIVEKLADSITQVAENVQANIDPLVVSDLHNDTPFIDQSAEVNASTVQESQQCFVCEEVYQGSRLCTRCSMPVHLTCCVFGSVGALCQLCYNNQSKI